MPNLKAELLVDCKNQLGECVLWNTDQQRVYWTDVYSCKLYSCKEDGSDLIIQELPDKLGSFAFDPDGNLLAAFSDGLFRYRIDTGEMDRLTIFEKELEATRLNDGRCDRSGRFIVGGCHEGFYNPVSSVVSYAGGSATRTLIDKVSLTNAIAFSVDGSRMYFSDSETRAIHAYAYDNANGILGEQMEFAKIDENEGFADGSCVDANDNLWNARYYGAFVQQYSRDGAEGIRIDVPSLCPTCVCFGGANLDTLFITSGCKDLNEEQRAEQPGAGGLYVAKLGIKGLPESRFAQHLF